MAHVLYWMTSPDGTPVDRNGDAVPRQFYPDFSAMHGRVPRSERLIYDHEYEVLHLQYMGPEADAAIEPDISTTVIFIDGMWRDYGELPLRAGWGVFCGPSSRHNAKGRVPEDEPQTSTLAVIKALEQALNIATELIMMDELHLRTVLIASHSQFVVTALSLWIELWIENGGVQMDGEPVFHFQKLSDLHERILQIEQEGGVVIKFWPIDEADAVDARALAESALNG